MFNREALYKKIKIFVENLKSAVATLPVSIHPLKPLVKAESKLSLDQFTLLLKDFIPQYEIQCKQILANFSGTEIDAVRMCLRPFSAFLNGRCAETHCTDADFSYASYSPINLTCEQLAEELSQILEVPVIELLLPFLKEKVDLAYRKKLAQLNCHQLVFADDGVTPIIIGECLQTAEKDKTVILYHTYGDQRLPLSESETNRVINHSSATINYYDIIQFAVKRQVSVDIDSSWQKNDFLKAYSSNDFYVKGSYDKDSNQRLMQSIVKKIKNDNQLSDLITSCFSNPQTREKDWKEFFKYFPLFDLEKILLKEQLLIDAVQKIHASEDVQVTKAILYCFSEIYLKRLELRKKEQAAKPQSDAWFGNYAKTLAHYGNNWFGDYGQRLAEYGSGLVEMSKEWLGGYSVPEKEEAVKTFQAFLASDMALNQLDEYLTLHHKEHVRGALFQGSLGIIASQALILHEINHSNQKGHLLTN